MSFLTFDPTNKTVLQILFNLFTNLVNIKINLPLNEPVVCFESNEENPKGFRFEKDF